MRSRLNVLAVIAIILACAKLRAETDENVIEFKSMPLKPGTTFRLMTQISVNVYGKSNQSLNVKKMRESWVLEADQNTATKLKVVYGDMHTKSTIKGFADSQPPVENKTYAVLPRGNPMVSTLDGAKVTDAETEFIKNDFIALGRPHPISTMLHGQKIATGEEIGSQDVLKKIITDYLSEVGVGEIRKMSARLFARNVYSGVDTAIFYLNLETGSSKLFPDSAAKLNGQLVVAVPSGLPVAFKLDGTLGINADGETPNAKPSRGTLSVTLLGELELPPEEKPKNINYDDDGYIIYGGRRMGGGRRR